MPKIRSCREGLTVTNALAYSGRASTDEKGVDRTIPWPRMEVIEASKVEVVSSKARRLNILNLSVFIPVNKSRCYKTFFFFVTCGKEQ